jgi:serine kinase of HPr protein (carbohydrate metabolism regulator)
MSAVAYGVQIGIRTSDASLAQSLMEHLPPGSTYSDFADSEREYSLVAEDDHRSGKSRYALYLNRALFARCATLAAALRVFETNVQLHIAEMAPDRVFLHAGVVGLHGCAILLPGRTFTGKSTLVAELIRAGADYYSDEYAVLDSSGRVHPYARPLSIREIGGFGMTKHSAGSLGAKVGKDPLRVGLVVVSQFRSGAEWQPQPLSPGQGALALLANTVSARRIPGIVLATLHQVVASAAMVTSDRGEASQVAELIIELAAKQLAC